ncbi:MAG TPA: hypothetical protein PLT92_14900 [Ignavibacteriaceae bacterium]|nr:hypothetical protein [Ignavibacteriaceae bacterium]
MNNKLRIYCSNCGEKTEILKDSPTMRCLNCHTSFRHIYSGGIHVIESLEQQNEKKEKPNLTDPTITKTFPNMIRSGKIREIHEKVEKSWQLFEGTVIPKPLVKYDLNDIVQHIRYGLNNSRMRSLMAGIPPVLVNTLLLKGIWTTKQWFEYLEQLPIPEKQKLLREFFDTHLGLQKYYIELSIVSESNNDALRNISLFSKSEQEGLIAQILKLDNPTLQFNCFWNFYRFSQFTGIKKQTLQYAFNSGKKIDDVADRISLLGLIYQDLPEMNQIEIQKIVDDIFLRILKETDADKDEDWGSFVLQLLIGIPKSYYAKYLQQIIDSVQNESNPEMKVWNVFALNKMGCKELGDKIYESLPDEYKISCLFFKTDFESTLSIDETLKFIADFQKTEYTEIDLMSISLLAFSYLLVKRGRYDEGLNIALSIKNTVLQKKALADLLAYLPQERSVKIANDYFVNHIDFENRAEEFDLLLKVEPFLDKVTRETIINQAFTAVKKISNDDIPFHMQEHEIPGFSVEERKREALSQIIPCLNINELLDLLDTYLSAGNSKGFHEQIEKMRATAYNDHQSQTDSVASGMAKYEPFSMEKIISSIEKIPIMEDPEPNVIVNDWMWDDRTNELQALISELAQRGYIDEALDQIIKVPEHYQYMGGFPRAYSLARLAPMMNARQIKRGLQIADECTSDRKIGNIIAKIILTSCSKDKNKSQLLENLFSDYREQLAKEDFPFKISQWPDDIITLIGENLPPESWTSFHKCLDSEYRFSLEEIYYNLLSGLPEKLRKQLSIKMTVVPEKGFSTFLKDFFTIKNQMNAVCFIDSYINNLDYFSDYELDVIEKEISNFIETETNPQNQEYIPENQILDNAYYLIRLGLPDRALSLLSKIQGSEDSSGLAVNLAITGNYEDAILLLKSIPESKYWMEC